MEELNSIAEHVKELIKIQNEYIKLLENGLSQSAGFLHVHGWRYDQSDIDKGAELRNKILLYKNL